MSTFNNMNSLFSLWKQKHASNKINLPKILMMMSKQAQLEEFIAILANMQYDFFQSQVLSRFYDEKNVQLRIQSENQTLSLGTSKNQAGGLQLDINHQDFYNINICLQYIMYDTQWNLPYDQQQFVEENFHKRGKDGNLLLVIFDNNQEMENSPLLQYLHNQDPSMNRTLILVKEPNEEEKAQSSQIKRQNLIFMNQKSIKLGLQYLNFNINNEKSFSQIFEELQQIYIQKINYQIPIIYRDVMKQQAGYLQQLKSLEQRACLNMKIDEFFQFDSNIKDIETQILQQIAYVSNFIRDTLDGKYPIDVTSLTNFNNFSLKSLMDLQIHMIFQEIEVDLFDRVESVTNQDIQKAMLEYNNSILDGFLSVEVFQSLYFKPMNELIEPIKNLLQTIHGMTTTSIVVNFTKQLRYFQFHDDLCEYLKAYCQEVYQEMDDFASKFLYMQVNTIFVPEKQFWQIQKEFYLTCESSEKMEQEGQQRDEYIKGKIHEEIKKKGILYVRKMLDIISETVPRILYSIYFGNIQNNLYLKVYGFFNEKQRENQLNFQNPQTLTNDQFYRTYNSLKEDLDLCKAIKKVIIKDSLASKYINEKTFVVNFERKLERQSNFGHSDSEDQNEQQQVKENQEKEEIKESVMQKQDVKEENQQNEDPNKRTNLSKDNLIKTNNNPAVPKKPSGNSFLNWFRQNKFEKQEEEQRQISTIQDLQQSQIKPSQQIDHAYRNTVAPRINHSQSVQLSGHQDENFDGKPQKSLREIPPKEQEQIFNSLFGNAAVGTKRQKGENQQQSQKSVPNNIEESKIEEIKVQDVVNFPQKESKNSRESSQIEFFHNHRDSSISNKSSRIRRNSADSQMTETEQENDSRQTNIITEFVIADPQQERKRKQLKKQEEQSKLEDQNISHGNQEVKEDQDNNVLKQKKYNLSRDIDWLMHIHNNTLKIVDKDTLILALSQGIPSTLRPSAWMILADVAENQAQYPQDYFQNLSSQPSDYDLQINQDIPRTYHTLPYFSNFKYDGKSQLFKVLRAYANHNKALGYTQGMNNIASVILMTLDHYGSFLTDQQKMEYLCNNENLTEQNTFWILQYIMDDLQWKEYIGQQTTKLVEIVMEFDDYIKIRLPKIAKHFENLGMNGFTLFTTYFVTLHSYNSPLQFSQRVLDMFLVQGVGILKESLIKMMQSCETEILQQKDMEKLFNFIKYELGPYCFTQYKRELEKMMQ